MKLNRKAVSLRSSIYADGELPAHKDYGILLLLCGHS